MSIGTLCTRDVATGSRETTVAEAAKQMRHRHVGDLVVVDESDGRRVPVGVVTDRDIVLSVVATGLDANVFTIGDLLLKKAVTCREDQGVLECLQTLRANGIRRAPVVDNEGGLVGIITLDDLVRLLATELSEVAKLISREQIREMKTRV
ncbi:MAG: CBS domain-containing protein [Acidobacteriota bacterium]